MLFSEIKAEIQLLRFSPAQSASIGFWVNTVGAQLWGSESWVFRQARSTNLTTTAGVQTLGGVPTDMGSVFGLFDQNGERIVYLAPKAFFTIYANQLGRGQPIHFTIVNGVFYLGPIPDSAQTTYVMLYERSYTLLVADAAVSPFPVEHHYGIFVAGPMAVGLTLYNDFTFDFVNGLYQQAVAALKRDFLVDQEGETIQWGRDQVDSVVLGAAQWGDVY